MSRKEQLVKYTRQFEEEHKREPFDTHEVARWLITKGLWQPQKDLAVQKCAEEISTALREVYITAQDGTRVRVYHARRINKDGRQQTLWANMFDAPRGHIEIALQQRREQVLGDCRQLKYDVDYYNQSHPTQPAIQISFDFGEDLAEEDALRNIKLAKAA